MQVSQKCQCFWIALKMVGERCKNNKKECKAFGENVQYVEKLQSNRTGNHIRPPHECLKLY